MDTSADTIVLLIDHNIQVPAKFTDKVAKRKTDKEKNPQAHKRRQALQHLTPSDYMAAGQTSIMDATVMQEQRDRVARTSTVKASSSGKGDTQGSGDLGSRAILGVVSALTRVILVRTFLITVLAKSPRLDPAPCFGPW